MPGTTPKSRGFTLVELAVTLTVLGLLLTFSVPAFNKINQTYQLKSTAESMSGTLRVWRERAISTGVEQQVHFQNGSSNWHIHTGPGGSTIVSGGKFPNGITLYTWTAHPTFTRDGRVKNDGTSWPGYWVLQNQRGVRDTVSVLASGLILSQ